MHVKKSFDIDNNHQAIINLCKMTVHIFFLHYGILLTLMNIDEVQQWHGKQCSICRVHFPRHACAAMTVIYPDNTVT